MTTSGTYSFDPAFGEIVIYSLNMCGIRGTAILQEHLESARMAVNMQLGRMSSQGVNLWAVDLQSVPLVAGTTTYDVPANTVVILDAYITQGSGQAQQNRIILPVSRTEYASYTNPFQQGIVTTFWHNRQLTNQTISLYYTPDGTWPTLSYYRMRQLQDANYTSGQTVEVPYYALETIATGTAARLAVIWAPDRAPGLKALADEAWQIFAAQNVETSQVFVAPIVAGYWRA